MRLVTAITVACLSLLLIVICFVFLSFALAAFLKPMMGETGGLLHRCRNLHLIAYSLYLVQAQAHRKALGALANRYSFVKITMTATNNQLPDEVNYRNLNEIRLRKAQLLTAIAKDNNKMSKLWNDLFHAPKKAATPTKRLSGILSTGAVILDGAILGWKLYRKLGGGKQFSLFRKRK